MSALFTRPNSCTYYCEKQEKERSFLKRRIPRIGRPLSNKKGEKGKMILLHLREKKAKSGNMARQGKFKTMERSRCSVWAACLIKGGKTNGFDPMDQNDVV